MHKWFNIRKSVIVLRTLVIKGNFLNLIKSICEKPATRTIFNGERLETTSLISGTRISAFLTSIHHCTGHPNQYNKARGKNKTHIDCKGKSKTVMIIAIENPKDSTRKLLELISSFNKVAR